jgi:hypothetical protein
MNNQSRDLFSICFCKSLFEIGGFCSVIFSKFLVFYLIFSTVTVKSIVGGKTATRDLSRYISPQPIVFYHLFFLLFLLLELFCQYEPIFKPK